ncbi:RNA polymerase sigma factor, sigma-70 family [Mycolicibacterium rutilum]|uniref:RNA polymerase sigma factor, sigma-70 family n=1 Tax=Mycolicibacterium rutilum TaxID=370526 RepID=A0A1H6L8S2_MYCRU|nr:sigma-70 family RNA polymerase sigma factor [Mycolicibacterium rutilum]SEH84696.1 RNA polymerase sigma factor, sigma-70 family [Mycolicibacterium rutilum]
MTAIFDPDILGPADSDAELTRAAVSGDKRAFAMIYDRYSNRLYDFCVGMLGDRDGAADCVQDVFCTAATQLPRLRDPDKLRPWLYSIARNEALRRIRDQRRETPTDDLPDTASGDAGPEALAARLELADLIADAAGGLSDRDRSVLELAFRHGLSGPDLAAVLGVTPATANTIVHRLRQNIERSLGALLVSRRVRADGGCAELRAILDGWDGTFNVLMRKRISRHIESCATCDEQRRRLASPAALLGAAPVFIPAPAWLRDQTLREVQLTSSTATVHPITARADEGRSSVLPVAVFVIALIAALGTVALWATSPTTTVPAPIEAGQTMAPPAPVHVVPAPVTPGVTAAPVTPGQGATVAPPAVTELTTAPVAPSSPSVTAPPPVTSPAPPPSWLPLPDPPRWPQFPQWPDGSGPDPGDPSDPRGTFTGPSDLGSLPPADPPPVG